MKKYSNLEKKLLNNYQHNFPISSTPYADIAKELNTSEYEILKTLKALTKQEIITRVGPVFKAGKVGVSTLCAMSIPEEKITKIANIISDFIEVNHNYEREHKFNLWFVVNDMTDKKLQQVIKKIETTTKYQVMQLPMLNDYHINLGFDIKWN